MRINMELSEGVPYYPARPILYMTSFAPVTLSARGPSLYFSGVENLTVYPEIICKVCTKGDAFLSENHNADILNVHSAK